MCISTDIAKFLVLVCRPPSVEKSVSVACFCLVYHLSGCFGFFLGSSACCSGRQTAIFTKCVCIFLLFSSPFNVSLKILLQSFQIVTRFQCALLTLSLPHPHGLLLADAYTSRAMPGGAILSSTAYPVSVCPFILSLFVLYFTSHTTRSPIIFLFSLFRVGLQRL